MEEIKTIFCLKCKLLYKNRDSHIIEHKKNLIDIPQTLLKQFCFDSCLGVGSYSAVFSVIDIEEENNEKLALKYFQYNKDSDISMEIEKLKQLNHPNIINPRRSIKKQLEGYIAVISECADYDLGEWLAKNQENSKIYEIILQICEGLNFIHNSQLIHGDLKPGNILIRKEKIKIVDVGLIKLRNSNQAKEWSALGEVAYNNMYLAPEYLKNIENREKFKYSDKLDIWGLGIIIHELVTKGKHPFQDNQNDSLRENVLANKLFIDKGINTESAVYSIILSYSKINFIFKFLKFFRLFKAKSM